MNPATQLRRIVCLLVASTPAALHAAELAYPAKPIRMVSPYAAGGGSDTLARILAQKLYEAWGQPVIVENRPGGGGVLGAETVARATPDGYTMLVTPSAVLTINPHLYPSLRYDTFRDFVPITIATNSPYFLVVHPKVPAANVKELIAYAKANPGKLNYSSSGSGSSTHLAGVLFNQMAGVDTVHIPYKGAAPAIVDLLAGNIQMRFSSVVPVLPHVRSGRLRGIAISSKRRYGPLPDVPTIAESGLPGYAVESFYAVVAPTGTSRAIIEKLNAALVRSLKSPEVATHMAADGAEVIASSAAELAKTLREDYERWAKPVKDSGARVD
ncbi:MAG: tripartite tricarboxylate transporter substrate binding protein [Betaproteobacteria bacterium]|nr:tripartite tricarboxylate transporter substrate binding protein [Betaproteobacteria bacterium]